MYEGMIDPGRWPKSYSCERTFAKFPKKAPTRAFSLLKVSTYTFSFKNLLRHNAKQAFKTDVKLGHLSSKIITNRRL